METIKEIQKHLKLKIKEVNQSEGSKKEEIELYIFKLIEELRNGYKEKNYKLNMVYSY
jgi:hypothetical protein